MNIGYIIRLGFILLWGSALQAISFGDVTGAITRALSGGGSKPTINCQNANQVADLAASIFLQGLKEADSIDDYIRNAATTQQGSDLWLWNYQPVRDSGCYDQIKARFWSKVSAISGDILRLRSECGDLAPQFAREFLDKLRKNPRDKQLVQAASSSDAADSWVWARLEARNKPCYDVTRVQFWRAIQGPAQQIISQAQPLQPVHPQGSGTILNIRGTQQYTKYFTNMTPNAMSVMLVDIAGVPHQVSVGAGSQGAVVFNQAGPVVKQIQITFQNAGSFFIRGAGQLGASDKGDLDKTNYIISGTNNYQAS